MKSKLIIILIFIIPFIVHTSEVQADPQKSVRGARGWGFFSEFFGALNHLEWCLRKKLIPVIYWDEQFSYSTPSGYNGKLNGWEYYFEPVSHEIYEEDDYIHRTSFYDKNFSAMWIYPQYVLNLHLLPKEERNKCLNISNFDYRQKKVVLYPETNIHLYDPKLREFVKTKLIDQFIRLNPHVLKKVNDFYTAFMKDKKTICIHLRGHFIDNEVAYISPEIIFERANELSNEDTQFFIATDQYPLLEQAKQTLNGNVISYDCFRTENTTSPKPGDKLDPAMGEDVLIETILLSRGDYLIHTLSNVSTAALYFNPELDHMLLY